MKLNSLASYSDIAEAHDRRHLLVHRLGRTDEIYRRTYHYTKKAVGVDEAYLLNLIAQILAFAQSVAEAAELLTEQPSETLKPTNEKRRRITVTSVQPTAEFALNPDFNFYVGDKLVILRDILLSRSGTSGEYTLVLEADMDTLAQYKKSLRSLEKRGKLIMVIR